VLLAVGLFFAVLTIREAALARRLDVDDSS